MNRGRPVTPEQFYKDFFLNSSVEAVLNNLKPYTPKNLILGRHFIPEGIMMLKKEQILYKGIPVEISENQYEIDFEL